MSLRNDQPPQAPLDAASLLLGLSTLHVDLSDIRTPEELLMDLRNSERTETLTEVDGPSRWEHRLCEGITSPIINDAPSSTTSNPLEVATKEGPSSEFLTAVFVALRSPVTKDRVREQLQTKTVQYLDIQDLEGSPSQDIQIWRYHRLMITPPSPVATPAAGERIGLGAARRGVRPFRRQTHYGERTHRANAPNRQGNAHP